jgi:hypothetical protein
MAADIAVVSFDRFLHGTDTERRVVADEIYAAFSSVGWVSERITPFRLWPRVLTDVHPDRCT